MTWWTYDTLARAASGEWLAAPADGASALPSTGVSIDSREKISGRAFVALRGERHDGHDHLDDAARAGASLLIVDRPPADDVLNASPPMLRVQDTRTALSDMASAYRLSRSDLRVYAITGSNGKTTTCRILYSVLSQRFRGSRSRKSFNNDIGLPLTLLNSREDDEFVVCEIGANAPGEIAPLSRIARPDGAIITCIGRAHIEGLGGRSGVAREKSAIVAGMPSDGVLLCRDRDEEVPAFVGDSVRIERFGQSDIAEHRITGLKSADDGQAIEIIVAGERYRIPLAGEHNGWNASAVVGLARTLGLSPTEIRSGLGAVQPPRMRTEVVTIRDISIVNDAYNANPDSARASLDTFVSLTPRARRRIVVLGDMLELGEDERREHEDLGREIAHRGDIDVLIGVGRLAGLASRSARSVSTRLSCDTMDRLTDADCDGLTAQFHPGDAVLLKGSRAMRLERIVEAMRASSARGDAATVAT